MIMKKLILFLLIVITLQGCVVAYYPHRMYGHNHAMIRRNIFSHYPHRYHNW